AARRSRQRGSRAAGRAGGGGPSPGDRSAGGRRVLHGPAASAARAPGRPPARRRGVRARRPRRLAPAPGAV
ncbi:MAG: hypothetical protein AVDCRST_MAG57-2692, partial [uncultured Blastococcus sp.]